MLESLMAKVPALPNTAAIADVVRRPSGLFALGAVVVLVLYGISVGRTKALISLLSIYVAYVLTILFPFPSKVPAVGIFLALYIVVFLILSHSLRRGRLTLGDTSLWQVAVISIVQIGLLASIGASLVSADMGRQYLGPLYTWLGGTKTLWIWAAASLLIMPFMRARRRD
jgi:hypothetical protein